MKKLFLLPVMLMATLTMSADTYPSMLFTNADGSTTLLSVTDLVITFEGGNVCVTNDGGTTLLPLTDLVTMQFSMEMSSIEDVISLNGAVEVWTLAGVRVGSFASGTEAASALSQGVYIVKSAVSTLKVKVQ